VNAVSFNLWNRINTFSNTSLNLHENFTFESLVEYYKNVRQPNAANTTSKHHRRQQRTNLNAHAGNVIAERAQAYFKPVKAKRNFCICSNYHKSEQTIRFSLTSCQYANSCVCSTGPYL